MTFTFQDLLCTPEGIGKALGFGVGVSGPRQGRVGGAAATGVGPHLPIPMLTVNFGSGNKSIFATQKNLPGYGPIPIADWSIIVQCHLLVKHGS
jgi:hypothetical protein